MIVIEKKKVLIKATKAKFVLFASAIQMLPVSRLNDAESWIGFPGERRRFLKLMALYPTKQFVVLSGDVHYAEIQCATLPFSKAVVIEATSSGISHAWGENEAVTPSHHTIDHVGEPDGIFNSRMYVAKFVQFAIRTFVNFVPSRYALETNTSNNHAQSFLEMVGLAWSQLSTLVLNPSASPVPHKLMGNSTWFGLNYGIVTIDGDILTIEVKDVEGVVRLHHRMRFGESLASKCNSIDFLLDEKPNSSKCSDYWNGTDVNRICFS
jgi:hypothetical protein